MIVPEQPFNAFLSGFSATVGQFVLTGELFCLVLSLSSLLCQASD